MAEGHLHGYPPLAPAPLTLLQVTLHAHSAREEGHISALLSAINPKTGEPLKAKPRCGGMEAAGGRGRARRGVEFGVEFGAYLLSPPSLGCLLQGVGVWV